MSGKGVSSAYSMADMIDLVGRALVALDRFGSGVPRVIKTRALVEWDGEERNRARPVVLDRLDLQRAVEALRKMEALKRRAASGGSTFRQTDPLKQAEQLFGSKAGKEALFGIASSRTVKGWFPDKEKGLPAKSRPSKANRQAITKAYEQARERARWRAVPEAKLEKAITEAATAIDAALSDRYAGSAIRLRQIETFTFDR